MNDPKIPTRSSISKTSSILPVKQDVKKPSEPTPVQKPTSLISPSSIAQKQDNAFKVAKSSKKITKVLTPRPAIEIYKPPVLRRDFTASKSSEDLPSITTRPFPVAGAQKQPFFCKNPKKTPSSNSSSFYDFKRNSSEFLHSNSTTAANKASSTLLANKMQYKNRTFIHNKSTESLRPANPSPIKSRGQDFAKNGFTNGQQRSSTPPADLNSRMKNNSQSDMMNFVHENGAKNGTTANSPGMKRSGSFVKDLPKKKTFGAKEVQDAKSLFEALGLPDDELIKKWISSNFESPEVAHPIGQVLVQMAIEHSKPVKTIGKLCALLIDCPTGDQFHQGLVKSCAQYYDCRAKLKDDHFKFWLAFISCLSELYANFGFLYEGELVNILLNVYCFVLQPVVLEHIKIEELEILISSLLSVGQNLERQCPEKLNDFLVKLRDSFIEANEPWVRKMLLLMIELSASNWKLPSEANEYYFQTHHGVNGNA